MKGFNYIVLLLSIYYRKAYLISKLGATISFLIFLVYKLVKYTVKLVSSVV